MATGKYGNIKRIYLKVRFRTQTGETIEGRTWLLPREVEDNWKTDQPIPVIYNRDRPKVFTVDLQGNENTRLANRF